MKVGKYLILANILFIFSCSNGIQKEKMNENIDDEFHLLGKQICSVDSILPKDSNRVIFLFNYYDCGSCVDSGFSITKKINRIHNSDKVFIVSTMGDTQFYQNRNKYSGYIYLDRQNLIRKELKYIQTPIMLLLDSKNKIVNYILPNITSNDKELLFINKTGFSDKLLQ